MNERNNSMKNQLDSQLAGIEWTEENRRAVLETIHGERPCGTRKVHAALVMALVIVALMGVALAAGAHWGVLDFVGKWEDQTLVLDNASEAVRQLHAMCETTHARFELREAVCDGGAIYVVADIIPKAQTTLLLQPDMTPEDPATILSEMTAAEKGTIAEYAEEHGYTDLIGIELTASSAEFGGVEASQQYTLNEDGSLTEIFIIPMADGMDGALKIAAVEMKRDAGGELDSREIVEMELALEQTEELWEAQSVEALSYDECGVRVDGVALRGTVLGVYMRIDYTVTDWDAYEALDDGLWFEALDDNGQRIMGGALGSGTAAIADAETGSYYQKECLIAMDRAPEKINLRAFNCWTKERYEAHAFIMTQP